MAAPKDRMVRLATVQMTYGDSQEQNIAKAVARVRQAAAMGANIVCLQELFNAPYPCRNEDHDRFQWAESVGVLGVGVCWDQWYSEAARLFNLATCSGNDAAMSTPSTLDDSSIQGIRLQ